MATLKAKHKGYKVTDPIKTRSEAKGYLDNLNTRQKKDMQSRLNELGYYDGEIDGIIGKKSISAYMKGGDEVQGDFEASENEIRDTIKELKSQYTKKDEIRALQNELIKAGFLDNSKGNAADGKIGVKTAMAYLELQKQQAEIGDDVVDLNYPNYEHPEDYYDRLPATQNQIEIDPSRYAELAGVGSGQPAMQNYPPQTLETPSYTDRFGAYNAMPGGGDAYDIPY